MEPVWELGGDGLPGWSAGWVGLCVPKPGYFPEGEGSSSLHTSGFVSRTGDRGAPVEWGPRLIRGEMSRCLFATFSCFLRSKEGGLELPC